jgi:hypothetical protein
MDIILGPVLGYEWDSEERKAYYTVLVRTAGSGAALSWEIDGTTVPMVRLAKFTDSEVWRGEVALPPFGEKPGRAVAYRILRGTAVLQAATGKKWNFWLPGAGERPRVAFATCNGFSDPKLVKATAEPDAMWDRLLAEHARKNDRHSGPFSLLLMGGDQLYCDEAVWEPGLWTKAWSFFTASEQKKFKPSAQDAEQLRTFYRDHYVRRWCGEGAKVQHDSMMQIMASVPSVMMWDDHDIFDGYGSHSSWRP